MVKLPDFSEKIALFLTKRLFFLAKKPSAK